MSSKGTSKGAWQSVGNGQQGKALVFTEAWVGCGGGEVVLLIKVVGALICGREKIPSLGIRGQWLEKAMYHVSNWLGLYWIINRTWLKNRTRGEGKQVNPKRSGSILIPSGCLCQFVSSKNQGPTWGYTAGHLLGGLFVKDEKGGEAREGRGAFALLCMCGRIGWDWKSLSLEAVLTKLHSDWWGVLKLKALVKIKLGLIGGTYWTIPMVLSQWLGAAHRKWGLSMNVGINPEGQLLGLSVNYTPHSRRPELHVLKAAIVSNGI